MQGHEATYIALSNRPYMTGTLAKWAINLHQPLNRRTQLFEVQPWYHIGTQQL